MWIGYDGLGTSAVSPGPTSVSIKWEKPSLAPIVVSARRGAPEPDVRTLRGWRRELVGAELLELLAGRRTLAVGDGGRVQVSEA